uniref:Coiled-coil domain-containing protein 86 n=1 Tax=Alexandrium catenella TaxID=2925 RepID=A0A7S1S0F1_ALECA
MVKGKAFRKQWKEARKPLNRRASSRIKSLNRPNFEERQKRKRDLDEVKIKAAELLEARKEVRKAKAKKREERKKRKEENNLRTGQFQVIKKTDKVRKWHKSAKKQLRTMGADQIEQLLKKKSSY